MIIVKKKLKKNFNIYITKKYNIYLQYTYKVIIFYLLISDSDDKVFESNLSGHYCSFVRVTGDE